MDAESEFGDGVEGEAGLEAEALVSSVGVSDAVLALSGMTLGLAGKALRASSSSFWISFGSSGSSVHWSSGPSSSRSSSTVFSSSSSSLGLSSGFRNGG